MTGEEGEVKRKLESSKIRRYYLKTEVAQHNCVHDCWVTLFNKVYDLTSVLQGSNTLSSYPNLDFAGTDVSHWFDPISKQPRVHVNPKSGLQVPFCPQGRYIHIPPAEPTGDWATEFGIPWWENDSIIVGSLTTRSRPIRIINTLTGHDDTLEVCSEETLEEILDRYLDYNSHASSYTWKRMGRILEMGKTLEENEILDERDEFEELGIDEDFYVPALMLYYNDDLTVA